MSSGVSVSLKLVDQVSARLDAIANAGEKAQSNILQFGDYANSAMDKAMNGANRVTESMNAASGAAEGLAGSGVKAEEALNQQASTADRAASEVDKFGDEAQEAADQSEELGEKGSQAAMDLGEAFVAAGIVTAMKAIIDAYNEFDAAADAFESSMAKVSTIADESAISLGAMQDQITKLSNETGVAVTDLAEATYGAISASVDTADAVSFVAQANALAVGGFTEQATAVDVLTTAINAYGMEADQAAHISDVLITTQNLGKTTVNELASSMGMVIPTASAYGVSLENLGAAYATMTAAGINTANATTNLNRVLAELADSGSDVAQILESQTGKSFTELMEEGNSLGDVMQILGDSVDGDTVAFSNLWSSAVAGRGALSLLNAGSEKFNDTLSQMENSAGAADKAFEKMSNTGEFVEKRWTNAINNLKIAIGDAQPSMDSLMSAGTDIVESLTQFVQENPAVVKAISAIAIGLGTMAVSLVGVTAAIKAADVVTKIWNTTLNANPIFLIVSAIAGFTAAVIALEVAMSDTVPAEERLIGTSQDLQDKIDAQRETVAEAEEKWGMFDDRTIEAKAKLEELEETFDSTSMTVGELMEKVEEQTNAFRESAKAHQENIRAIDDEAQSSLVLLSKLQELETASNKTTEQKALEKNIIEELKGTYPELAESYNEVTGKIEMSTAALKKYIQQKAEEKKYQADIERYTDLLIEREEAEKNVEVAVASAKATEEDRMRAYVDYTQAVANGNVLLAYECHQTIKSFEEQAEEARKTEEALAAIDEELNELGSKYGLTGEAINQTAEATNNMISTTEGLKEAMSGIFASVEEDAQNLAAAYREAYTAAREAVESSFGLFEEMTTETTNDADQMVQALESQIEYLNNYQSNLQTAKEMGLDASLVEHLADGSQESADQLQAIIDKVNELGEGSDAAQEFVDKMNSAFEGVSSAKDSLAETMTEMNTELKTQMDELVRKMQEGVNNLDLSGPAATAAQQTMTAYANNIETYGQQAVNKAEAVASAIESAMNRVTAAMNSMSNGYPSGYSATGHAAGTTYGEDVYIAGERGPELIVGRRGSEVFPASETAKILNAVMKSGDDREVALGLSPQEITQITRNYNESTSTENRHITLTLNGKGALNIGSGVSMSDVRDYIAANIETEIEKIIMREIEEEGEINYEF